MGPTALEDLVLVVESVGAKVRYLSSLGNTIEFIDQLWQAELTLDTLLQAKA